MYKMKKGKATGADEVRLEMLEMTGEVGVKWTGRLLEEERGKYRGITLLSQVLKLLERVLDARIRRRVEGDFGGRAARVEEGERNSRRDVCPATDDREETGGTGQYDSGVRRPGESF